MTPTTTTPPTAMLPNPLLPGFNPDPSIVKVEDTYYLVTSTFEYLPGLPVYRSTDLVSWTQIGNVATRPEQVQVGAVPTGGGVYAPTIRHRDGVFYVIVTVALSPAGCRLFTATDPAGPWSDGVTLDGVDGIDPDLVWDDDGTAYVTFSGISFGGTGHSGVRQVRVDLDRGVVLEEARPLWSGTGLQFPEAPHLYQRGDWWYLLIAEGGTERGHAVSVARGTSPAGPFEGCPDNPVLSARSTTREVQCTGHGDLVDTPDGSTALVLLGTRPLGLTSAFSPLGRETFVTTVEWVQDWPRPAPVQLAPRPETSGEVFDFTDPDVLQDPGWLSVRTLPTSVATTAGGHLVITADGRDLTDPAPSWVGRRQRHHTTTVTTRLDVSDGVGGLAARYGEDEWFALEARSEGNTVVVTGQARVPGLAQDWTVVLPAGDVQLHVDTTPPPRGLVVHALGGDRIRLSASSGDTHVQVAELDGRFWSSETCTSFTGRTIGVFATRGTVRFADFRYSGSDAETGPRVVGG